MLGWIAETTVVAAGMALVALLASRLLSIGPTIRHMLWLVVLIKLVTPPIVSWPWAIPWRVVSWHSSAGQMFVNGGLSQSAQQDTKTTVVQVISYEDKPPRIRIENGPERARVIQCAPEVTAVPGYLWSWPASLPLPGAPVQWLASAWLAVSVVLGGAQAIRIVRFRRLLEAAIPAPDELIDEANLISLRLGVSMPELLVVPDLGTPLLWCLGRPRLLVPARLVKTLSLDRWRGIITHELAHLRRGDHWVSRLELAAGLIWWWNPIYWLARGRLDAEAELACDGWVVWALPKDRLVYAEVLFDICATLSLARPPAPVLGVAGSGRFFERRLNMILHDHVTCRLTPAGLLGACLLLLIALPSWSAVPATVVADRPATSSSEPAPAQGAHTDDDKDAAAGRAKAKADAKAKKSDPEIDIDLSAIEKEIESKFGPGSDFEKKVEAFAKEVEAKFGSGSDFEKKIEAFAKEVEAKFGLGSDFEKKIEAFAKEVEAKFGSGSDFEKKTEAFGKDMEAKFGPDSDFEKKIETFGKEVEAKFGPGSDLEKSMKTFREDMKEKFGPGSDFAKEANAQAKAGADVEAQKQTPQKPLRSRSRSRPDTGDSLAEGKNRRREQRIRALEVQIDKLVVEIKALKSDSCHERDDQE
jgi:beta-lactamase regulating signal transducer with metallopeptidase domain